MGTWVLDLDGVVWRGTELIPGSDEAVRLLLERGTEVVFCTNHAMSPDSKLESLRRLGVPECPVITAGEAAGAAVGPDQRVLVLGDPTLVSLLEDIGLDATDVHDLVDGAPCEGFDAVIVGATGRWDRSRIGMAADAVRGGARFLATNDDPTFPTTGPAGARLLPGNGALVSAVSVAAGVAAEVTGKPFAATADLIVRRHGPVDVVVGDKPETDGRLAVRLGATFGLVLSGVTSADDLPVDPDPWTTHEDLLALVTASSGPTLTSASVG